jgi:hypothetical protein
MTTRAPLATSRFDVDGIVGRNLCLSLLGRRSLVAGLVDRFGGNCLAGIHFWTLHSHYGHVDTVHALCLQLPFMQQQQELWQVHWSFKQLGLGRGGGHEYRLAQHE